MASATPGNVIQTNSWNEKFHSLFSTSEQNELIARIKDESPQGDVKNHPIAKFIIPLLRDLFKEKNKEDMVESLPEEDIHSLFSAISVISFASDLDIHESQRDNRYLETLSITKKAKSDHSHREYLEKIYVENKKNSLILIRKRIEELEEKYFKENFTNIQNLRASNNPDKELIIENIRKSSTSKEQHDIYDTIKRLNTDIILIEKDIRFSINPALNAEVNDRKFLNRVALIIHKPHLLSTSYLLSGIKFSQILMKWFFKNIPIVTVRDIIIAQKNGFNIEDYFVKKYNPKDGFEDIYTIINSEYMHPPFSQVVCCKKTAIKELISCYRKKLLYPSTCGLLAMIEGILWSLAEFMHDCGENIFIYNEDSEQKQITAIISKNDGSYNKNTTIGTLLKISKLNNLLDRHFIEFFCQDFYKSRNEILHGENWHDATPQQTAAKFAVLEYILSESHKYTKAYWANWAKEHIPDGLIQELYNSMIIQDNNHSKGKAKKKTNKPHEKR